MPEVGDGILENLENIVGSVPGFRNEMLHDLEDAREMQLLGSTNRMRVTGAASGGLLLNFPNGFAAYMPFRLLARSTRERLELEGLALDGNGEEDAHAMGGGLGRDGTEEEAPREGVEGKRRQVLESLVGTDIEVAVCHIDLHTANRVTVVLMEAGLAADIARAEEMLKLGRPELFTLEAATNSGLAVDMGHGLEAFLPYSLLGATTRRHVDARLAELKLQAQPVDPKRLRRPALEAVVGRELSLCVTEVQKRPGRPGKAVLSEKAAHAHWAANGADARPADALQPGNRVQGYVQNVKPYGLFVDMHRPEGVFVGLVHKSELAWGSPPKGWEAQYAAGQQLEVEVIDVRGRGSAEPQPTTLSVRRLTPDPSQQTFRDLTGSGSQSGGDLGQAAAAAPPLALPGISEFQDLCADLQGSAGVTGVEVQDCRHAPSFVPEMQVFLSSEDVPGGFELVCRRGIMLQSAHVRTVLSRPVIKNLLQKLSAGRGGSSGASDELPPE